MAIFSYSNGHFFVVQAFNNQINIFPSSFSYENNGEEYPWQGANNALYQDLSPQSQFDDFNKLNSAYIIFPKINEINSQAPEPSSERGGATEAQSDSDNPLNSNSQIEPIFNTGESDSNNNSNNNQDNQENGSEQPANNEGSGNENTNNSSLAPETNNSDNSSENGENSSNDNSGSESTPAAASSETPSSQESSQLNNRILAGLSGFLKKSKIIFSNTTDDIFGLDFAKAQTLSTTTNNDSITENKTANDEPGKSNNIIFKDFSLPLSSEDKTLGRISLRMSLAAISDFSDDKISIEYTLDDSWKMLGEIDMGQSVSNGDLGDYLQFELPKDIGWEELNSLKIRLSYINPDSQNDSKKLEVYLDAIWLELEYDDNMNELETSTTTDEIEENILENENFDWEFLSQKTFFKNSEIPEFEFSYKRKKNFVRKVLSTLISPFWDEYKNIQIKAVIKGADEKERGEIEPIINYLENGRFRIEISKQPRQFKPGKQKLEIQIIDGSEEYEISQEFSWGVLAFNVNKSVYLPGETAYLQMAVLNNNGDTLCAVDSLTVEIKAPNGKKTYLSTYNGDITINPLCAKNNVIDTPDFYGYFQTSDVGTYEVIIKAVTENGEQTMDDKFEVKSDLPFDLERTGPTRIYPVAPYKVGFKIKVNQDYTGEFIEQVPLSFDIMEENSLEIKTFEDYKEIIWHVDWKQGEEHALFYKFDAPDVSPEFYLLGPAKIGDFSEMRNWQIASDQPGGEVDHYFKNYDAAVTKTINYTTDGYQEVTEYMIASTTFESGKKYLIATNFAILNDNANQNTMARVRHGNTEFDDSTFRWESRRNTVADTGHGYQYFTVWTAVSGEDIHIDVSNAGNNDYDVTTEGYEAFVIELSDKLTQNSDWYYATSTHSGNLTTSWSTNGASATIAGGGNDWMIIGLGRFLADDTSSDFRMRLYNSTDAAGYGDLRYETEDANDYRPVMTMVARNISGTKSFRVDANVDTAASHDWSHSKIFALNLNKFRDHSIIYSTTARTITPQDTWVEMRGTTTHSVYKQVDTLVWSQENVTVNEDTKSIYSRIQIDGTTYPTGHDDAKKELPTGSSDINAHHNFLIQNLTAGNRDIDVDMNEDLDATPNSSASLHSLVVFSMELASTTYLISSANQQYGTNGTTTIANGGWADGGVWFSGSTIDATTTTSQVDFYFQVATTSGTLRTSTSTSGLTTCSSGTAYESCNSKVWKVSTTTKSGNVFSEKVSIPTIPDSSTGYKWQMMACEIGRICADWDTFNSTVPNFKVDGTPPTAPGNLTYKSKSFNKVELNFGSASSEPYFDQYRIFYKKGTSGVTSGDTEFNKTNDVNLDYVNYNGATYTTITGLDSDTTYVFNIWAYNDAGNNTPAIQELTITTSPAPRLRTVRFLAGTYNGNGTTGQQTNTNNTFSAFNFSLAEDNVDIVNAYLIYEIHYEAYSAGANNYTGYNLSFDACQEPCSSAAFSGSGAVLQDDNTVLSYDEQESNQVRLLFDVTDEVQIASYAGGGASLEGQAGYRIEQSSTLNAIAKANAELVVTYYYDADSPSLTNTVVYPLESTASGDSGSRLSSQTDDCTLNSDCPLFSYNMNIPEYSTILGSTRLSQWFTTSEIGDNNDASDMRVDLNIESNGATSTTYIHEAALNGTQGVMPKVFFNSVPGFTENSNQYLEYHGYSTGAVTHYLIGGEVSQTYTASSSASIKTRTISFPIGVITNGLTTNLNSGSTNIYFPENGNTTGKVDVKKAWLRIVVNNYNTGSNSIDVTTKTGTNATSTAKTYNYDVGTTIVKPSFYFIHVIPDSDYAELENANGEIPKNIKVNIDSTNGTTQGGVSVELMITYTYSDELNGYLSNVSLFAGQSSSNGNTTSATSTLIAYAPESNYKTMLAAALLPSYLLSDSDGNLETNFRFGADISTTTASCTNSYYSYTDSINSFSEYYADVKSKLLTTNNQGYSICYTNNGGGDTDDTAGGKMNSQLIYTYKYYNPIPFEMYDYNQYKSDELTSIPNGDWTNESEVNLLTLSTDSGSSTQLKYYFNLIGNADAYSTSTEPTSYCSSGDSFGSCSSKTWRDVVNIGSSDWYDTDWLYRKKITINSSLVQGSLIDFPVLATTTDSHMAYTTFGGHVASSTGGDILVTDSDGLTPLDFEKEYYASSTGKLVLWIKTDLSTTTNKVLYIYYGNSSATNNLATTSGVWDSNYAAVWHLKETGAGTAGEYKDSTINANNGRGGGGTSGRIPTIETSGWIGPGQYFDGAGATGDYIDCGNATTLNGAKTAITVESWIRHTASGGDGHIAANGGGWGQNGFSSFWYTNHIRTEFDGSYADDSLIADDGAWHHIVTTWDASTQHRYVYVDGVSQSVGDYTGTQINAGAYNFNIGRFAYNPTSYEFNGRIDEVRVSNYQRSSAWIRTEYYNQRSVGNFMTVASEESYANPVYEGKVNVTSIPDSSTGYKWQLMMCNDLDYCTPWIKFDTPPNFKVDATPPTAPGNLTLATTTATTITLNFGAQTEESNFAYYKIFYKEGLTEVDENDTERIDSNLNYIDYNSASTTRIIGLKPQTRYVINIWAYDLAGNKTSASEISVLTSGASHSRIRTVMFPAGVYSGNGTTGQNSDTNQTFTSFNFKLAETEADIKNAYILFEAHYEAYSLTGANDYTYSLAFDACADPCTPDAFSGTGNVIQMDNNILSYDEGASNQVRILADVTNEVQLSSYGGEGAIYNAQVGYRLNRSSAMANSIASAKAKLIVTYTYNSDNSPSYTNTVVYPLESAMSGDSGSRQALQSSVCTLNSNCPIFTYTITAPEIKSKLAGWYETYFVNYNNAAVDVTTDVNIETYNVSSNAYVHESVLGNAQGAMPMILFDNVYGFAANTAQSLEYHASSTAGSFYVMGGEVYETYTASSSAATKTRTVSFPIGIVSNGNSINTASSSAYVYFPENGGGSGVVDIKKAWFRIKGSDYNSGGAYNLTVSSKVGSNLQSGNYIYNVRAANTSVKPSFTTVHVIPSADYTELEAANASIPKQITVYTTNSSANMGGVSAELMITYTYTSETSGYLSSADVYGGQSTYNGNSMNSTSTGITTFFPELRGSMTMRAAGLLNSNLISDSGNNVPNAWFTMDSNIAISSPVCTNAFSDIPDSVNAYVEYYRNVDSSITIDNEQTYVVCQSNYNATRATAGAKMNSILKYTYQWLAPQPQFTQSDWRWYYNIDNIQPTTARAAAKTAITGINIGDVVRLRMNIGVSEEDLNANNQEFILQYGKGAICSSISTWVDVGDLSSSAAWRGYNNPAPIDGTTLSAALLASSSVVESYEEANSSVANPNEVSVGEYAEWDWLIYDNNASSSSGYCFRMVKADGTELEDYLSTSYPKLTTNVSNIKPSNAYNLGQYRDDGTTVIANAAWINDDAVMLRAAATDPNINETITLYFEFIPNSSSFRTATSAPTGACTYGTSYSTCASKVWFVAPSTSGDYRTTPYIGTTSITSISTSTSDYKWQVLACDDDGDCSSWVQPASAPNIRVDTTPPTPPGNLTFATSTPTSITLNFGASTTEANFSRYRIYYKPGISGVTESNYEHSDSNLLFKDYNGKATTTVINLSANTSYVFNIWAYDLSGNKATATVEAVGTTKTSFTSPTGSINSVSQKTNGTGVVDVTLLVDDPDNDDTLRAKISYVAGTNCSINPQLDPTIDTADANTTATYGDPKVDNNHQYQVGTSTGWIYTSFGANYVAFDWQSKTDLPTADGTYCVSLVVNDTIFNQTATATKLVLIDNVNPTAPGALTLNDKDYDSIKLNFGSISSDNHFSRYRIYYKKGTSGVTESDTEFNDLNLLNVFYNFAASTTISGLEANTNYVFNIWAYDQYGNSASSTEISIKTNASPTNISALNQYRDDGVTSITNNSWINDNAVILSASAHDQDAGDLVTFYYELINSNSSFTSASGVPVNTCSSGTNYSDCTSHVWSISTTSSSLPADWYNNDWLYRKKITINSSQVLANQTNFVVLATTTDTDLITGARTDGYDIIFTKANGTTTLSFEREYFDKSTGKLAAWVQTDISSTTNTDIYMYFGNSAYDTDKSTTTIWSSDYRGIWHLGDSVVDESSANGAHQDSSSKNNDGSQNGNNEINSWIGLGQEFDGNDKITVPDGSSLDLTNGLTLSAWVKVTDKAYWKYKRDITLSATTTVANYQVKVLLGASNFIYTNRTKAAGADLRFYDTSGNILSYWIESWNTSGTSTVWVKVPTIGTSQIAMYYGNESATAASNFLNVMDAGGLRYFYYDGMAFNTLLGTDIDTDVNFTTTGVVTINGNSWENQSETMSIRWEGFVSPNGLGNTTFYTTSDDGQRFYLPYNTRLIDNWVDQADTTQNTTVSLNATSSIKYEYYENGGTATARLQWDPPGSSQVVIPSTYLYNRKYMATEPNTTVGEEQASGIYKAGAYGLVIDQDVVSGMVNSSIASSTLGTGWNMVTMTYDRTAGSNQQKLYINNQLVKQTTYSTAITSNSSNLIFGSVLRGIFDEVRISSSTKNFNFIKTEYNNQRSVKNFMTVGAKERAASYFETALVVNIPDSQSSTQGYKWQVKACDDDDDCTSWSHYNDTVPNFKIDVTPPTAPGALSENSKTSKSIILNFGATSTEVNFSRYRIFYSTSSPVTESSTEHTDSDLNYINYNSTTMTTISGLTPSTQYYFNIWAYDLAGNKATSTPISITTNAPISSPGAVFYTKNTRVLYYRVWSGTSWGIEQTGPTLGSAPGDNIIQVKSLKSDDSGKIAVIAKTWDGTNQEWWATVYRFAANNFVNSTQIGTAVASNNNIRLMTGCLASLSGGEFMVVHNNNASDGTLVYSWNATDGWTSESAGPDPVAVLAGCELIRRPNTDNYLLIMHDDDNDINSSYYYGGSTYANSWTTITEHSANEQNADNYVGEGFFDSGDNTRGAINFSNSATNAYTQAKFFTCNNTTINYGSATSSPAVWTGAFVQGMFASDPGNTGIAYFVGSDAGNRLSTLKMNVGSGLAQWSSVTNGTNITNTQLYAYTNFAHYPFSINSYKSGKTTVIWSNSTQQYPYYSIITTSANSLSASSTVPGAGLNIYPRIKTYKDPNEDEFLLLAQNDDIDYSAVFWDGANDEFYSTGNQAWTELVTASGAANANDENITFSFASSNSTPSTPTSLVQKKSNRITVISNGSWTNESSVNFSANINDVDTSERLKVYLQLVTTGSTFNSSTTQPTSYCSTSTTFSLCDSKIWLIGSSTVSDFSVNPYQASSTITGIPDSATGYKWQIKACDDSSACTSWTVYNATTPNFKVDITKPINLGALTIASAGSQTVTLNFGASTTESNFKEYKIFYRIGSSGVTESDTLWGSSSDPNLAYKNYNGQTNTIVLNLASSTQYVFNIWAYDLAGNVASATPAVSTTTKVIYKLRQASFLFENDDAGDVNSNTAPVSASTSLTNVQLGERINARIQIENYGGDIAANKVYKLQYENFTDAAGTWVDVGLATPISFSYGLSGGNGNIITSNKANANSNFWYNGSWHENVNTTANYSLNNGGYTEFVFAVKTNYATANKTYRLRLYNNTDSKVLNNYRALPAITTVASASMRYSKESLATLPSDNSDLTYYFDPQGYTYINTDDNNRDSLTSVSSYPVTMFVRKNTNNTDAITVNWYGQSSVAASTKKIYLQVYKYGSPNQWITVASSTTAVANMDFNLTGTLNSSLSSYYDASYWTYWRVYQDTGNQVLSSDYFTISFSAAVKETRQKHFRWRNDDGSESAASWRESEDIGDPVSPTANLNKNEKIRLRVEVANLGGGTASNQVFRLQYATTTTGICSSATAWTNMPLDSTGHWRIATSTYFANGDSTISRFNNSESYTFVTGRMVEHPSATTSAISLSEGRYTEAEYEILATSNAVSAGSYCFRATNNGTALDYYDKYPLITLAGSSNYTPAFYVHPTDGGSASTSPTNYGEDIAFSAIAGDRDGDDYYLAICKTNSITAGNDGAPTCNNGEWCISTLTASSSEATCSYTAADSSESLAWYAFACDKKAGFGLAKCSTVSQGNSTYANNSPFVINHRPTFTSVTTGNNNQAPGSTFTINTVSSDTDSSGGSDTLYLFVCLTNSANFSGCAGGAGDTVCSAAATSSPNAKCSFKDTAPTPATTVTYYAFLYDRHGLAASANSRSSSYTIINVAPTLGTLVLHNGSNITLNIRPSQTTIQTYEASAVDLNGCDNMISAVATIYMSNAAGGYSCTANNNNCYQITNANCVKSDCSGTDDTSAIYTCTSQFEYYAAPTDASSGNPNSAYNWLSRLQIYDGSNYSATTSQGVELITSTALDVTENLINFGSNMFPGENTGNKNATTTITNLGNSPIDTNIKGTDMSGNPSGLITSTYIEWNLTSGFNWSSGNDLTNTDYLVDTIMPKATSTNAIIDKMYWGIGIPIGSDASYYTGLNTFSVTLDSDNW